MRQHADPFSAWCLFSKRGGVMNDSFENIARGRLTKLAAATLACSVLCLIPNGFLAMLGYLGINLVMVFGFVFYRNRKAYSGIEYLFSDNRYIYRTILWGCLWLNLLAAVFCSGIVYFIISNSDQFRQLFQELISSIPADLLSSIRNNTALSDADNEKIIGALISVYQAHEKELRDLIFSSSFILFVAVPFFSIIIPVIWMIFRSIRAIGALKKRKDVYTGTVYSGDSDSGSFVQEA